MFWESDKNCCMCSRIPFRSCSFDKNELCNLVLELLTILGIYNVKAFIRTFETLDTSYVCIILLYTS